MRRWSLGLLSALALGAPAAAHAHRNYSNPELAWTCKLGEAALLCGMSAPAKALERVLMRPLDFKVAPSPAEQRALRTELETLFRLKNAVEIDGVRVAPKARSLTLLMDLPHDDVEDPALKVPGITLHQSRWGIVRFVVTYPLVEGAPRPQTISLTWDTVAAFARLTEDGRVERVDTLAGSLMIDGRWIEVAFTAAAPTFVWRASDTPQLYDGAVPRVERRSSAVPVASGVALVVGLIVVGGLLRTRRRWVPAAVGVLVVAGALLPVTTDWVLPGSPAVATGDAARARQVFEALLSNIYRAFEADDEAAIYDTLAGSVDGPLLDTIYADVYESLTLREDGGARCRVDGVDIERAELQPGPDDDTFVIEARWRVTGTVTHEQHRHRRTNQYHARYTVGLREAGWRLVAVEVLDLRRMALATQDVPLDDAP